MNFLFPVIKKEETRSNLNARSSNTVSLAQRQNYMNILMEHQYNKQPLIEYLTQIRDI